MSPWFDWTSPDLAPHGYCLAWNPGLLATHALSDLAMGLSYIAVAGCILWFGRRRPDMAAPGLFAALAVVFALCGLVHLSDILVLWTPAYGLQGGFKAAAALASLATAAVIVRLMPRAVKLPSVAQLREVNAALEHTVMRQQQTENRLRLLSEAVEQSSSAVIITDPEGVIEYVNPRFSALSGWRREDAVGRTPRILRSGGTPPEVYAAMWAALKGGRPWRGEFKDRRRDGSEFWVATAVTPVRDGDGRVRHFVAMQDDITERKLAEERLREAGELAEIANRAKSELIANMSHELRTPLNAIIGFSSALIEGSLGAVENAKHREYLRDIHGSGEHLLSLINDILDVSAIEVGKINLKEEPVALDAVLESSLRMVAPRAQAGGVAVSSALPPHLPELVVDARRLKQVLVNLIGNAVKFTPSGGRVRVWAAVETGGGLAIGVADTGIGMSEAELGKALQPFGQVESSLSRRYEGTGLGLPLSKGLIEAHGGSMAIASRKGAGTEVVVRLPAARLRVAVA